MSQLAGEFAAVAVTLYAAHHVGDYWVQTDHQARHKGDAGLQGEMSCAGHVLSYLATQAAFLIAAEFALGQMTRWIGFCVALLVSGVTHYLADRREHGLMFKLARLLPGKAAFMELGKLRPYEIFVKDVRIDLPRGPVPTDNPQLATGTWALDQAWHIFWGVFVAALLAVTL